MLQEEEFEPIFKRHYSALYQVSLNILRDKDLAHDAVQEVFIKLWNKRKTLLFNAPVEIYLRKAVVNTSLTLVKQQGRNIYLDDRFDLPYLEDLPPDHDTFRAVLESGIRTLTPKSRTIFILSRMEGLDNQEIASYLDISKKTVENQLAIALKKLREYMETQRSKYPDIFSAFLVLFF